jgi:adenylate cyclase
MDRIGNLAPLDLLSGIGIRQIRITCGLILFSYLLSHFTNHALGNISFAAMEDGLDYHMRFWRDPVVATVFYTAAIVHWGLGLWALYERRQFRYPVPEVTQLVLGLSIPFLLVIHFVGVRLAAPLFGRDVYYPQVISSYWISRPVVHWIQFALLLVAWTHGCIGLYFWLRLRRFFSWAAPYLLAAAVLVPTLALLGLIQGAREVIALSANPEWRAIHMKPLSTAQRELRDSIIAYSALTYAAVIGLIFAARGARLLWERRHGTVGLTYPDGRVVRVPRGMSVLEASLRYNIPHASVCGGKARCSTCRIRVRGDPRALPQPSYREAFVLERVGARNDPAIRLACQLRPVSDLAFWLIFPPQMNAAGVRRSVKVNSGEERYVVCMFVDMRRSTAMAEKRLPYDTMFFINRFLGAVAAAVEESGGRPNQFVGDGLLALFGLDCDRETACRRSLDAVTKIAANMAKLNQDLAGDLHEPIQYGIGINGGEVIIGDVGYRDQIVFTALGDAVNVAARLQDLTKTYACEAVVADEICRSAGVSADDRSIRDAKIQGRDEPILVRLVS